MTLHRWLKTLSAAASVALVTACATTPKQEAPAQTQRYYFPAPPDAPRLQFLTSMDRGSALATSAQANSSFGQWIAGDDPAKAPRDRFDTPYGVDAYNGKLYVCDVGFNCIHVVNVATRKYSLLGSPDLFRNPVNITVDRRDGFKYVCDTVRGMVLVFDADDRFVREFGDPRTLTPMDLAIDGDELYIVDSTGCEVEVWSRDGKRLRTIGRKGIGPDELDGPSNLALGPDGRVYVADTLAQQVKIFDKQGSYNGSIGVPGDQIGSFGRPKGIAIDQHGHVYVSDAQWRVVQIFTGNDRLLLVISGMGGKAPGIVVPAAIAIDSTSIGAFSKYIDPDFQAEYLVFLVNQYGRNKVSVYAYGRSKSLPAEAYQPKPPTAAPAQ